MIKQAAIVEITRLKRLPNRTLLAPISLPMIAQDASDIPKGIMKAYASTLKVITYVAYSLTPITPAKMVKISKAHHSAHSTTVTGTESLKIFTPMLE